MKYDNLLSILIPTYNRYELTKALVSDLLSQIDENNLYGCVEVIVCDNSTSFDDKIKFKNSLSNHNHVVKYYDTGENIGPTANWIQCILHATHRYSLFVFSDDYLNKDGLIHIFRMLKNSSCDIYFLKAQINTNGKFVNYLDYEEFINLNTDVLLKQFLTTEKLPVSPGCTVLKTEKLKTINFDKIINKYPGARKMGAGSDAFIIYSCLKEANKIFFSSLDLIVLRDHEDSFTGSSNSKKEVIRNIAILKLDLIRQEFGLFQYVYYFFIKQFEMPIIHMRIKLWSIN